MDFNTTPILFKTLFINDLNNVRFQGKLLNAEI